MAPLVKFLASNEELAGVLGSNVVRAFAAIPSMKLMLRGAGMKTISATQNFDDESSLDKAAHISITDEAVDVAANGGVAGAIIINEITGDIEVTTTSNDVPLTATLKKAEANVDIEAANVNTGSGVVINTAKIGAKAKATGKAVIDSSGAPTSVEYDASASVKVGFSISGGTACSSGKYIIEASYYDNGDLTAADLEDASTAMSNFELTITIKVYDNSNDLVDTYTIDQDDITDYINSLYAD
jgi:hypothetical protein